MDSWYMLSGGMEVLHELTHWSWLMLQSGVIYERKIGTELKDSIVDYDPNQWPGTIGGPPNG